MEQAPALASLALLALVALILGVLLFFAARRPPELMYEGDGATPQPSGGAQEARFPEARRRKLEKALVDERPVRNAIVHTTSLSA